MFHKQIATVSAAALLAFSAVPGLAETHAMTEHPETGEALAAEQTYSYRLLDQFPTLDPQLNEETAGNHVIRQLFEGLMIQDAEGNLRPGVAEGFEASEGNTVYTFKLREDATWSNGDPVTAQDFVYGWQRAADPETASPYAWYVELTSMKNAAQIVAGEMDPSELGVEAVDERTLKVTLTQPLPYFPAMTTYATLLPAHKATIEEFGSDWTRPENMVNNGAYNLKELALNEYFTLEKNPEYWDAENVIIEEVTGLVINDENQALTRYESGEFDMLEPLPAGAYPRLEEERPDEAHSVPRLCSYYYAFNLRDDAKPELQDPKVREALNLAVDREVIVDQILQGGQTPAYNFAHAATAGFEMPNIAMASMSQAERDARAKELMEEAGVDELELKLIYNTSENHKQIATVVTQMWKQKLGVETTLENMEWSTYLDVRKAGNFDLARSAWCGDYNEASTFLDLLTTTHGSNDGQFSNEEYDALMAASKTSDTPNEQYSQAEQIIAEQSAIIPVYHYSNTFLLNPAVKGFPMQNVENNWYVKDFYRTAEE
ncbi:peptide ABC transporter substrate-binding protein [Profundibacterium mesophilum]|uniref:Oligopeptide ABC transporter periplasmic oligopeptide-binding protein n=1 Tax=Profundibacterium mesophilum KAUST100406-0324 TaxID=1037889 RepID=A0A921NY43_9RHOB|nr:peptide ABC transporter substrate-binding protein [Profundibacterium mesophilum]KAF0675638.1 Oligopeptide ABC transporter periplasmic oligopeptide-binding protein [Profundibacterium mesophilum KAUST100406-0324]